MSLDLRFIIFTTKEIGKYISNNSTIIEYHNTIFGNIHSLNYRSLIDVRLSRLLTWLVMPRETSSPHKE